MTFRDLYRFKEELIDTSYGPILRCTDLAHGDRDVAVKIVSLPHRRMLSEIASSRSHETDNPLIEKHIVQQLQATLGHPNVLQYHEVMEENRGEVLIFVMEYCGKGDLLNVMSQLSPNQRFEECQALHLFRHVVAGVKFLHDHGIAHRDLSLENVLVSDEDVCKVCDFGLSCKTSDVCHSSVGKCYYMAPEVIAGKAYNGVQADIWSLGMILFIMLTGSPLCELAREDCLTMVIVKQYGVRKILEYWGTPEVASASTVDLLNGMLQLSPAQRLGVDRILAHSALIKIRMQTDMKAYLRNESDR